MTFDDFISYCLNLPIETVVELKNPYALGIILIALGNTSANIIPSSDEEAQDLDIWLSEALMSLAYGIEDAS